MAGITSYGAYIPMYRLSRETLAQVWGGKGKGEKAVANADEDSLTMGVEAARDCIKGFDKSSIDALYFATTTPPYKEKQSASIMAAACDLREDIITADFADSIRSATIAILMALDAVKAGSAKQVLVIAADTRLAGPDTRYESLFGDGAAAFLIGNEGVVAEIEGNHCITSAFVDFWRLEYDKIIRSWEERLTREESYMPYMTKAISTVLEKQNLTAKDISKAVIYSPDTSMQREVIKKAGFDPKEQVQDLMFDSVGHTGAALTPMVLVSALEGAKPGDRILTANYEDGADAIVMRVTDEIGKMKDRRAIKGYLASKMMLPNYGKYMRFRNLMEWEHDLFMERRMALAEVWRHRNFYLRFHGAKCTKCGHIMTPIPKMCIYCQADEKYFEEVPMADKRGKLVTYSMDVRSRAIDPPNILAVVNFDGGGRFYSQMTDRNPDNIEIGMTMELTFRRIHDALGIHNYFWKCRPARG
ncbi:MAG: hydroxymethylglutaryl-CoA synthase [Dehalococcoidia bacterium]|nr:hydroxymethylglutaryl-CoA synthase [Dehalococcoidia bacterium]